MYVCTFLQQYRIHMDIDNSRNFLGIMYDVSFYNSTASSWTLATPRTTWESMYGVQYPEAKVGLMDE